MGIQRGSEAILSDLSSVALAKEEAKQSTSQLDIPCSIPVLVKTGIRYSLGHPERRLSAICVAIPYSLTTIN